jgi:hypothetical protein
MKTFKIVAFALMVVYIAFGEYIKMITYVKYDGQWANEIVILQQWKMMVGYVAIPVFIVYLYKRLK